MSRVEYPIALGGTGCFTIVELELITTPTPVIPVAIDLVACDDDGDGLADFDLTLQQDIIFGRSRSYRLYPYLSYYRA